MSRSREPLAMLLAAPNASAPMLDWLFDVLLPVGPAPTDMTFGEAAREFLDTKVMSAAGKSLALHAERFACRPARSGFYHDGAHVLAQVSD